MHAKHEARISRYIHITSVLLFVWPIHEEETETSLDSPQRQRDNHPDSSLNFRN